MSQENGTANKTLTAKPDHLRPISSIYIVKPENCHVVLYPTHRYMHMYRHTHI